MAGKIGLSGGERPKSERNIEFGFSQSELFLPESSQRCGRKRLASRDWAANQVRADVESTR